MSQRARTGRPADPVRAWRTWAWLGGVVALVLAPTWRAGYVLSYDMVFTPRQDLLPAALGLGGGLPRAVPQDAVVAILTTLVPGWLLQKVVLTGSLLAAGLGAARLTAARRWWVGALAGTVYVWNAWVAERLVLGHWGLLLAYAVLPWALAAAIDVRRGGRGAVRLVLLCALAALTPSGGLLVAVLAVPVAVAPRGASRRGRRAALAGAVVLVNAPWWLPSLLHPGAGLSDPDGGAVFALRPEGPWGPLLTALGLGGIWNADAVPLSRAWWVAPAAAVLVVAAAVVGWRPLARRLGRVASWWLAGVALAGLLVAVASAWGPTRSLVVTAVSQVPGLGLLRDSHKALAPLSLLLAVAGALGVARLLRRVVDPAARGALAALCLVLPIVVLPDLAWGAAARLAPVAYPPEWAAVRTRLQAEPGSGDVVVVPWAAFRAFGWNDRRTLLDPAPRWLPVSSVTDDSLVVRRGADLVTVSGEDPRSAAVAAALARGRPLSAVLPALAVGWVLVEEGQPPGVVDGALSGLQPDLRDGELSLWRVPGPIAVLPPPAHAPLVIAVDALVVAVLVALAVRQGWAAIRRRPPTPRDPPVTSTADPSGPDAATLTPDHS